jgi:hypothetical protein
MLLGGGGEPARAIPSIGVENLTRRLVARLL